jgi:hypothetical protein
MGRFFTLILLLSAATASAADEKSWKRFGEFLTETLR